MEDGGHLLCLITKLFSYHALTVDSDIMLPFPVLLIYFLVSCFWVFETATPPVAKFLHVMPSCFFHVDHGFTFLLRSSPRVCYPGFLLDKVMTRRESNLDGGFPRTPSRCASGEMVRDHRETWDLSYWIDLDRWAASIVKLTGCRFGDGMSWKMDVM